MAKFRKKPIVVDAIQLPPLDDPAAFKATVGDLFDFMDGSEWMTTDDRGLAIVTLEGTMKAAPGDWIIRGTAGEIYPCKPDIFADIYEPA